MIYDMIAPIYDAVNGEIDYKAWADFIESMIRKHYPNAPELVLDLGCGTGRMTLEMARRGYDMTGVDYSPEMLDVARENLENEGLMDKTLLLCQHRRAIAADAATQNHYLFHISVYRIFNVASVTAQSIIEIMKNRITILVSKTPCFW